MTFGDHDLDSKKIVRKKNFDEKYFWYFENFWDLENFSGGGAKKI